MFHATDLGPQQAAAQLVASVGLAAGTPVSTPRGSLPVETLREGDSVVTREFGIQRTVSISRSHGLARLVQIDRDAIAPGVPTASITVGAETMILLRDRRPGGTYPATIIEAAELINGIDIHDAGICETELTRPVFDEGRVIYSHGVEIVSPVFF